MSQLGTICHYKTRKKLKMNINQYKLCYVESENNLLKLYFANVTNKSFNSLWGDDWNDAPYEHNAEIPYDVLGNKEKTPVEFYSIILESPLIGTPSHGYLNSPYSVEQINFKQVVPWVSNNNDYSKERKDRCKLEIYSKTKLKDVLEKIKDFNNKLEDDFEFYGIKVYKEAS